MKTTKMPESASANEKLQKVKAILQSFQKPAVAFSGGTDSGLLLRLAFELHGKKMMAVIVDAPMMSAEEIRDAESFCASLGCDYTTVFVDPFQIKGFADNPPDRCYLCKRELFSAIRKTAANFACTVTLDGTNADDTTVYRPGLRALSELGVRSPLKEAGLTKAEVRAIAKELGIPTWDKPAAPCLATRFPYGEKLTKEKLARVAAAERLLETLGLTQFRVRSHADLARIEIPKADFDPFMRALAGDDIPARFRELGFAYVTLDLEGFRSGSMDEVFSKEM